jgi:hypothetical protein
VQKLLLAKPLKQSKKFVTQSSGLIVSEKTSSVNRKIVGGKRSSTTTCGNGAARALTRALDLFHLGSSASDGEAAILAPPRKHPQKSPISKSVLRPLL